MTRNSTATPAATSPQSPASIEAQTWLDHFNQALQNRNTAAATSLFEPQGFWRDLVAFTWNIKTLEGRDAIQAMLTETLAQVQP
ncbi:hypothetical protein, partial [Gilvimarinus sp. 1_MG-2023]